MADNHHDDGLDADANNDDGIHGEPEDEHVEIDGGQDDNDDQENIQEEDWDEETLRLYRRQQRALERIAANDPAVTSFRETWLPLNDREAIQLGIALVGNTHVRELILEMAPGMTDVGANALRDGISVSHVKELQLNRRDEMPFDMAQLYADTMQQLESLNLAFPIDDENLAILEEGLSGNESLNCLFLHGIENMTPHGAQSLVNGLCDSQLETLELMGHGDGQDEITRDAMKIVYLQGVMGCPTIEYLQLFGMMGNVQDLATALPKLSVLTMADIEHGLSLADAQTLSDGLRQATNLVVLRLWAGDLGDEHLHILSPILANHPSLEQFDVRVNKVGDEAVAWFVDHWNPHSKIRELDFTQNNIGTMGAQCLFRAARASHPTFRQLVLDRNQAIGYDGLQRIGQELMMAGLKLTRLSLDSVTTWVEYDDVTCEAAVEQASKRALASKLLLDGLWANVYLQELSVKGNHLPRPVTAELGVVIKANRNGRIYLSEQHREPPMFWCHFLAQQSRDNDLLFLFLRERPTIVAPNNHGRV